MHVVYISRYNIRIQQHETSGDFLGPHSDQLHRADYCSTRCLSSVVHS